MTRLLITRYELSRDIPVANDFSIRSSGDFEDPIKERMDRAPQGHDAGQEQAVLNEYTRALCDGPSALIQGVAERTAITNDDVEGLVGQAFQFHNVIETPPSY
jgi:hypothetical protein